MISSEDSLIVWSRGVSSGRSRLDDVAGAIAVRSTSFPLAEDFGIGTGLMTGSRTGSFSGHIGSEEGRTGDSKLSLDVSNKGR